MQYIILYSISGISWKIQCGISRCYVIIMEFTQLSLSPLKKEIFLHFEYFRFRTTLPGNILSKQVICELINDQNYFYNIAKAKQNDPKCFPTSFSYIRFTRANRILRLYVSTLNPSFEFLRIVSYIMNSILVLIQTASVLFSKRFKFVSFHMYL